MFIKIELCGGAPADIHERLHSYMIRKRWLATVQGAEGATRLPHAVYHGEYDETPGTLSELLHADIASRVWATPTVLVVTAADFAMTSVVRS